MAKAYQAAEPAMDDLLASIRRAIDSDTVMHGRQPQHVFGSSPRPVAAAPLTRQPVFDRRNFGTAPRITSPERAESLSEDFRQLRDKLARELSDLDQMVGGYVPAAAPVSPPPSQRAFTPEFRAPPPSAPRSYPTHESAVRSLQPLPYGAPAQRGYTAAPPSPSFPAQPQPDYLRPLRGAGPAQQPAAAVPAQSAPSAHPGFASVLSRPAPAPSSHPPPPPPPQRGSSVSPQDLRAVPSLSDDVIREMLQPVLRDWLDTHLPGIVERLVREEIQRVSRRGGR